MAQLIDQATVKGLQPPETGNRITYDSEIKGFGIRVTASGARSFVLNYRHGGRERRYTIGSVSAWSVKTARVRAKELRREIDQGRDPMAERHAERAAPTVEDLANLFVAKHLIKRRPATQADYKTIIAKYIKPHLGRIKVDALASEDIEDMHASIAKLHPYQANRTLAVVAKMLELAESWKFRPKNTNPAKGLEKSPEFARERYLSPDEIVRVVEALHTLPEQRSADVIRLLLLTGARKAEVLNSLWTEFDLGRGVWVKPRAPTRTKRTNHVPLSEAAQELLANMRARADEAAGDGQKSEYLFPGVRGKALGDVKRSWATICAKAGLGAHVQGRDAAGRLTQVWRSDVRIHDLRHTFASILASGGLSLPIIGKLVDFC